MLTDREAKLVNYLNYSGMSPIKSIQTVPCSVLAWTIIIVILGFGCQAIQGRTNENEGSTVHVDGAHIPKTFDYGQYVEKYHKSYTLVETLEKARYFFSRTIAIFKHNILFVSKKVSHYLRQTEYTDLTPKEMEKVFKQDNSGLQPVEEAYLYPDLPADQLWSVAKLQDDPNEEKISMTAAVEPVREFRKPVLNFLADEDRNSKPDLSDANHDDLLAQLIKQKRNKKELARLVSLSSDSDHKSDDDVSQKARQLRGIHYRAVVEPDNGDYDPSSLPSQGILENMEIMGNNYAKFMMDDFVAGLEPYPSPIIPQRRVLANGDDDKDSDDLKKQPLFSFMNSVKSIFDFFNVEPDEAGMINNDNDSDSDNEDEDDNRLNQTDIDVHKKSLIQQVNNNNNNNQVQFDVDWRKSGCISRPRAQGNCNSCYAFATLDLMEFFYCRQRKNFTEFSVQYVIDCGSKTSLNGCTGGKLSYVGRFIQLYGLQLESLYPYSATQNVCPFDGPNYSPPLKPELKGWRMFQDMAAWYKWLPKSPIMVGVNMPGDFLAYGGGVHDGADCVPGMAHAMLLVGSGTQDGHPFWLIKNSFSADWGEQGYFRLSKKAPLRCFNSVVVARVKFSNETSASSQEQN